MTEKEKTERLVYLEKQLRFTHSQHNAFIKHFGEEWLEEYIDEILDEINNLRKK